MSTPHWTHFDDLSFNQFDMLAVKQSSLSHLVILVACPLVDAGFKEQGHRGVLLYCDSRSDGAYAGGCALRLAASTSITCARVRSRSRVSGVSSASGVEAT